MDPQARKNKKERKEKKLNAAGMSKKVFWLCLGIPLGLILAYVIVLVIILNL